MSSSTNDIVVSSLSVRELLEREELYLSNLSIIRQEKERRGIAPPAYTRSAPLQVNAKASVTKKSQCISKGEKRRNAVQKAGFNGKKSGKNGKSGKKNSKNKKIIPTVHTIKTVLNDHNIPYTTTLNKGQLWDIVKKNRLVRETEFAHINK